MEKEKYTLRHLLTKDAERYLHVKNASIFKAYIKCPLFRYVFWLRVSKTLKQRKLTKYLFAPIPVLLFRHLCYKYGLFVDPNIEIGPGLKIIHPGGIFLNAKCVGSNFTIYQGVTLGETPGKGVPVVKDNVTIYAGAKVIGNVILNPGCQIGANAVVTKDIPANTVAVGIPAVPLKRIN